MERCKGDYYVSLVRNLRFSRLSCTFPVWETYGSASGNVECGSRFVSLNIRMHVLLLIFYQVMTQAKSCHLQSQ